MESRTTCSSYDLAEKTKKSNWMCTWFELHGRIQSIIRIYLYNQGIYVRSCISLHYYYRIRRSSRKTNARLPLWIIHTNLIFLLSWQPANLTTRGNKSGRGRGSGPRSNWPVFIVVTYVMQHFPGRRPGQLHYRLFTGIIQGFINNKGNQNQELTLRNCFSVLQ